MSTFLSIIITFSFILLLIGFIKPGFSLFWFRGKPTRAKSALIYGLLLIGAVSISTYLGVNELNSKPVKFSASQKDSIRVHDSIAFSKKLELNKEEVVASRISMIERQFNGYDGSHINLERYIKKNMNDNDSYEHIETKYWDMKDHIVVLTKFRGSNAFGAKVINTIKAEIDMDGNVIKIIEQF